MSDEPLSEEEYPIDGDSELLCELHGLLAARGKPVRVNSIGVGGMVVHSLKMDAARENVLFDGSFHGFYAGECNLREEADNELGFCERIDLYRALIAAVSGRTQPPMEAAETKPTTRQTLEEALKLADKDPETVYYQDAIAALKTLAVEVVRVHGAAEQLFKDIDNDAHTMTFQSVGQYRSALLKRINQLFEIK